MADGSTTQPAAFFGLPSDVQYCKNCVISNQRPSSAIEFKNNNKKEVIHFDDDGLCSACRYHESKWNEIDWEARQQELLKLLDRHRSKDGSYDVIVPGSGGKDSIYVSHVLKYKYGMHPLTVTWPPNMCTDIGWQNFKSWIDSGLDNISFHQNGRIHRYLTRAAFLNLGHPFQPFILGQKQVGPKTALRYGVKLIMYGESQAEEGNRIDEAYDPVMNPNYFSVPRAEHRHVTLGGLSYDEIIANGFSACDLQAYLPAAREDIDEAGIEVHHMGYYEHWRNQDKFYYAVENTGFNPNPERTEGTYSKYAGLDDRIDGFHYYTTFIKFGIGRASYDAAQEIRNRHITREEGVALVHRYDGEFPKRYFQDFLDYVDIDEDTFWKTIDSYRSPHLWRKDGNEWALRKRVEQL
ncbi:MAG: N-acetyl sugar amidotransferase [Rhodospirillaceae bacterium]|nr:N-acetyl sugar amidotransferase [Rhodospirillaceae bacterium]